MNSLEGISLTEIDEKDIEKQSITVDESFYNYDDCKLENEQKEVYDYSDCVKTEFDIEEEKRKLQQLRTMFADCGLIDSDNKKIK